MVSTFSRELEAMEQAEADDVRCRAGRAQSVDEYLDALREAGSLGAGIVCVGYRATPKSITPYVDPFSDPDSEWNDYTSRHQAIVTAAMDGMDLTLHKAVALAGELLGGRRECRAQREDAQ